MTESPRILFVADECSSISPEYYRLAQTWLGRMEAAGNLRYCENFFKVENDDE